MNHAPLPWHIRKHVSYNVQDASGHLVANYSNLATAHLIVQAVNAHATLGEMLISLGVAISRYHKYQAPPSEYVIPDAQKSSVASALAKGEKP